MNTLAMLVSIVTIVGWVAYNENKGTSDNGRINMMVKADLKAERKRGDILSQRRRGNYR